MARTYLIFIAIFGMLGAMVSNCSSQLPSASVSSDPALEVGATDYDNGGNARSASLDSGAVEIPRSSDGHFYADVEINGEPVRMLVDTGATAIALSQDDARRAGIATSIGMNDVVGRGADGEVRGEVVSLDRVSLGDTSVEGLGAIILRNGEQSLLGQNFLSQFSSVEIQGDTMVLR